MSEHLPLPSNGGPSHENGSSTNISQSNISQPSRPGYMTVGEGSASQNAARLTAMIDNDSGYGGSLHDGDSSSSRSRFDRMDFSDTLIDVPVPLSSSSQHCTA